MSEIILNNENFVEEVMNSPVPVFVDFWAPWCGPCRMMGPIVEELAEEYKSKNIKICKLNVDENSDMAEKYGIRSIPTFIIFKNGEVAEQISGGMDKDRLKEFLEKHVSL